jgi:hypothetical protein
MIAVPPFVFTVATRVPALSVRIRAVAAFLAAFTAAVSAWATTHGNNIGRRRCSPDCAV